MTGETDMSAPWLVRTFDGCFRVKWRDAEGMLQDREIRKAKLDQE
jgi:hypothetical protein